MKINEVKNLTDGLPKEESNDPLNWLIGNAPNHVITYVDEILKKNRRLRKYKKIYAKLRKLLYKLEQEGYNDEVTEEQQSVQPNTKISK